MMATAPAAALCVRCRAEIIATRLPLTERQAQIYDAIKTFITAHGYAPSFKEIAEGCGYRSLATVFEHLKNLERKGWIIRTKSADRSIALVEVQS